MASIESAIFTALTASQGHLYTHIAARVYPEVMPQGATLPCVVYTRVSTQRRQALGSAQTVLASRPRFQFTCWALTASGAIEVADAVITQLRGMANAVKFENESASRDAETNLHRRDVDVFIVHGGQ